MPPPPPLSPEFLDRACNFAHVVLPHTSARVSSFSSFLHFFLSLVVHSSRTRSSKMASTASTSRGAPLRTLMQQTHKNTRSFATSPITHAESSSSPSRSAASSSSSTSSNASFSGSGGGGRKGRPQRSAPLPPYPEWIAGQGKAYETAPTGKGPFWIASTPFPLNPTFNPSPPLSQQVRNLMWTLHSQDPETNSVRALSGRFGTAMERVTAVLRLKALEREHVQLVSKEFAVSFRFL